MDEFKKGVQLGTRAAASYLEAEADELIERAKKGTHVAVFMTAEELAQYLRNHADEIREMTVTRGR